MRCASFLPSVLDPLGAVIREAARTAAAADLRSAGAGAENSSVSASFLELGTT